jgi:hypothetical protein
VQTQRKAFSTDVHRPGSRALSCASIRRVVDHSCLGNDRRGLWLREDTQPELTRRQVDGLLATSEWQSPLPGVLADGGYALDARQWALTCVLASGGTDPSGKPRAVACGRDAARVWGFPLIDDDDPATGACERYLHDVHVFGRGLGVLRGTPPLREPGATPHPEQLRCHELRRYRLALLPGEYGLLPGGLWVTTKLHAALQCVQLLSPEAAVCVLDHGLHRKLFTRTDLADAVAARRGKPGGRKLASAVALVDGRSESPNETLARLLLLPHLPSLVPQVEIQVRGRVVARVDLGDKDVRLAVEMDGKRAHAGEAMVAKDDRRNRRTRELGWITERGVWYDVRCRQDEFVERIVARYRSLQPPA